MQCQIEGFSRSFVIIVDPLMLLSLQELLDKILSDDFPASILDKEVLGELGAAAAAAPLAGPLPSDSSPVQRQKDTRRWQRSNRPQEAAAGARLAREVGAAEGLRGAGAAVDGVNLSGGSIGRDAFPRGSTSGGLGGSVSISLTDSSIMGGEAAATGAAEIAAAGDAAGGVREGHSLLPSWLKGSGTSSEVTLPSTILSEQLRAAAAAGRAGRGAAQAPPADAAVGGDGWSRAAAADGGAWEGPGVAVSGRWQQQQQRASPSTSFTISTPSGLTTSSSSQGSISGALAAAMVAAAGRGAPASTALQWQQQQQQQLGAGRGRIRELVMGDIARTASPSSSMTSLPSTLFRGAAALGSSSGVAAREIAPASGAADSAAAWRGARGSDTRAGVDLSASVSSGASINALLEELLSLADTLPIDDPDEQAAAARGGRGMDDASRDDWSGMGLAETAAAGAGVSSGSDLSDSLGTPQGLLDSVLEAWLAEEMAVSQGQQQQQGMAGAAAGRYNPPSSSSVLSLPTTVARQLGERGVQWGAVAADRTTEHARGGSSITSTTMTLPTTVLEAQGTMLHGAQQGEMQEQQRQQWAGEHGAEGAGVASPSSSISLPSTLQPLGQGPVPERGELEGPSNPTLPSILLLCSLQPLTCPCSNLSCQYHRPFSVCWINAYANRHKGGGGGHGLVYLIHSLLDKVLHYDIIFQSTVWQLTQRHL